MKCDYILGITVMKGDGDAELRASHVALGKKYSSLPGFVGLMRYLYDIQYLLTDTSEFDKIKNKENVGLYWEIHANQNQTEPSIEVLAELTAGLFNQGIRFRKINLSGCFTAGMDAGDGAGEPVDFSHSLQSTFCELLAKLVKEPENLEGCMVCGYRSIIILYDPESEFFSKQAHADKKFQAVGPAVQNTFSSSSAGSLSPTHPKRVDFNEFEGYMNKRAEKIKDFAKKKAEFDENNLGFITNPKLDNQLQALDMSKVYLAVCNYIRLKRVMIFQNKKWRPGSLAEWSDNQTMQQLVSEVEYFNRSEVSKYLKKVNCKVRIVP